VKDRTGKKGLPTTAIKTPAVSLIKHIGINNTLFVLFAHYTCIINCFPFGEGTVKGQIHKKILLTAAVNISPSIKRH
jgi:hypothetical protein